MLKNLAKDQMKEAKFIFDSESLVSLANEAPDDLLVWVGGQEYLISKLGANDIPHSFESADDFFKWRLAVNDNNLNKFAKELGYLNGKPYCTAWDFLQDFDFTDEEILRDKVTECYQSTKLGDWLYE
ncbi:hypothetical protein KDZ21_03735 [Lactobacillus crispatus]|uniref:hypothetical protein n=1 Tax=Lactobacillus crispatus TaxID=47770 RepID=UPI001C4E1DB5|nr:hypothetical protein [Lactobacillus crispatus]MBW0437241.1 hypothetical protein [Lactobacillus crispatus]MBW0443712.1 hypothetical protein [Lactobacillus crispatus]MBW0455838.1 hypothetical protein [Lactobacillus crispatus]